MLVFARTMIVCKKNLYTTLCLFTFFFGLSHILYQQLVKLSIYKIKENMSRRLACDEFQNFFFNPLCKILVFFFNFVKFQLKNFFKSSIDQSSGCRVRGRKKLPKNKLNTITSITTYFVLVTRFLALISTTDQKG